MACHGAADDYASDDRDSVDDGKQAAGLVKRAWSENEDALLLAAVEKYGACRWSIIATHLSSGRVGKQCRERWNNHLCPDVKKSEWGDDEDRAILHGVAELGTRWCEIVKAPALAGRTDNAIKNRFYALQRRMKAAHSAAVRTAAAAQRNSGEGSPLGKRQWSAADGGGAKSETDTYQETRDKVVSIATALAFSIEQCDRDRLIAMLTSTLHPRAAKPGAKATATGGGGAAPNNEPKATDGSELDAEGAALAASQRCHSPLSAAEMTGDAASDMAAFMNVAHSISSPTASTPRTLSPVGSEPNRDDNPLGAGAGGDGDAEKASPDAAEAERGPRGAADDVGWAEGVVDESMSETTPLERQGPTASPSLDRAGSVGSVGSVGSAGSVTVPSLRSDDDDDDAAPADGQQRRTLGEGGAVAAATDDMDTGETPQSGTKEPGAAKSPPPQLAQPRSPAPAERPADNAALGSCLGGRHKYRALLAPLAIPEVVEQATMEATLLASDSAKRQRTPSGHTPGGRAAAAWSASPQRGGALATPPSAATGTEEPGAAERASFGSSPLVAKVAALVSPLKGGGAAAAVAAAAAAGLEALPEHLQLSFFTDLFAEPANVANVEVALATLAAVEASAAAAAAAAAAAPAAPAAAAAAAATVALASPFAVPRGLSPAERMQPRRPSPLVPSPVAPSPQKPPPRRGTRHTRMAAPIAAA